MSLGSGVHNLTLIVRAYNRSSRALNSVGRDLTMLDKNRQFVQKGFQQLSSIGLLAIKAFAIGAIAAIGGVIYAWSKFQDALATSLAITEDVTPVMRERLENTAREVAKTTIFSAAQAAGAYFHLFSSGLDAAQSMQVLPLVAKFAQAGLMDLSAATEYLVTAQNALGLSVEDPIKNMLNMTRVANVLAKADMVAVGTIQEFSEALTHTAAATMRTYNIEIEEGVAVLAAWASAGLKGASAGTAFSIVTRDLMNSVRKEPAAWKAAGLAIYDSTGNLKNLAEVVALLEEALVPLSDQAKKKLLFELGFQERSQHRLLQLLGMSDEIREFEAAFRSAGTAVEDVAEKQLDSPIKQMILLKNSIVDLFLSAGDSFDEGFVDVIIKVRQWVNRIGPDFKNFTEELAEDMRVAAGIVGRAWDRVTHVGMGFTVFTGDLPKEIETIVSWIERLIAAFQTLPPWVQTAVGDIAKLVPVIALVSGALRILAFVFAVIAGPGVIVATVIAGIVTAFKTAYEQSAGFKKFIDELVTGAGQVWSQLVHTFTGQDFGNEIDNLPQWIQNAVFGIAAAWRWLQRVGPILWDGIVTGWENLRDWWNNEAYPWIQEMLVTLRPVWDTIKEEAGNLWDTIVDRWNELYPTFVLIGERIKEWWENIKVAWAAFNVWWDEHGDEVVIVLQFLVKELGSFLGFIITVGAGIIQFLTGVFLRDWRTTWNGIKNIFGGVATYFAEKVANIGETIALLLFPDQRAKIEAAFDKLREVIENPMESLKTVIDNVLDFLEERLAQFIDTMAGLIPGLSWIKALADAIGIGGGGSGMGGAGPGAGTGGGDKRQGSSRGKGGSPIPANPNALLAFGGGPGPGALSTRQMALLAGINFTKPAAGTTTQAAPTAVTSPTQVIIEKLEYNRDPVALANEVAWKIRTS